MKSITPIGDRILVEPAKTSDKIGSLYIPEQSKEKPAECVVISLGTGKVLDSGKTVPFPVKIGDKILISKYGGTEIRVDGKDYKLCQTDDILAILN